MLDKSVQEINKEQKQQKQNAYRALKQLVKTGLRLSRPVFIVPGWTDENCWNWTKPYLLQLPLRIWTSKIVKNSKLVNYVTFTDEETKSCNNFLDFGAVLKKYIDGKIGIGNECDLVGHSMGGLDIRAAIAVYGLENIVNCITVATPHKGAMLAEIQELLNICKYSPHHEAQCKSLARRSKEITELNLLDNRKKFLEEIQKLFQFSGTWDKVVQIKESRLETRDLSQALRDKTMQVLISDVEHSGVKSITRDVRVVLAILDILIGIEPEKPKYNYGYIYRKA